MTAPPATGHCLIHAEYTDRFGSGLPKIRSGWERAGHALRLFESFEPFDHAVREMTRAVVHGKKTPISIHMRAHMYRKVDFLYICRLGGDQ